MAIGGHHQPAGSAVGSSRRDAERWRRQHGAVIALAEVFVAQMLGEEFGNQLHHGAPAGTVGHIDTTVFQIQWSDVTALDFAHQCISL